MGVGWRKLAPLWALALTLACAQHMGKAPTEQLSRGGPDLASPWFPYIRGRLWAREGGRQLRGLALGPREAERV